MRRSPRRTGSASGCSCRDAAASSTAMAPPIAVNRENFRVQLVAEQTKDTVATLDALAQFIPVTDVDRQRVMKEIRRRRAFVPATVRENLDWQDVSRIEVNSLDLPGIAINVGQSREYPYGSDAVHILGYVGAVTEAELTGESLLEHPDFRIGKNGIEKAYDLGLRGTAGTRQVEVNAAGRVIKELETREGKRGDDVRLTIDIELQRLAMQRLSQEKSASAVAMDTAPARCCFSRPRRASIQRVRQGLSSEYWKTLTTDPRAPLTNKAISGQYAPGSTFKMIVALAALEGGIAGPEQLGLLQGRHSPRQREVPLLEKGRPWLDEHAPGPPAIVRRLLLRAGQEGRDRPHRQDGDAVRPRQPHGDRASRRKGRADSDRRIGNAPSPAFRGSRARPSWRRSGRDSSCRPRCSSPS